jgi:hypothetical protein
MQHNVSRHVADGDDLGPYDFGSVMHYPPGSVRVLRGQPGWAVALRGGADRLADQRVAALLGGLDDDAYRLTGGVRGPPFGYPPP